MSDSGYSNLSPELSRRISQLRAERLAQNARVEDTSGELGDVRKATRLRGEVVERRKDNTVRVRTERGEVTVKVSGREAQIPREGDQVDIELQPGRPPRQARIDAVPPEAVQQETSSQADAPTNAPTQNAEPVNTEITADIPKTIQTIKDSAAPLPQTPPATARASALLPDTLIRLTPVTEDQIIPVLPGTQTVQSAPDNIIDNYATIKAKNITALATLNAQQIINETVATLYSPPATDLGAPLTITQINDTTINSSVFTNAPDNINQTGNSKATIQSSTQTELLSAAHSFIKPQITSNIQITQSTYNTAQSPTHNLGQAALPRQNQLVQLPALTSLAASQIQTHLQHITQHTAQLITTTPQNISTGITPQPQTQHTSPATSAKFIDARIVNIDSQSTHLFDPQQLHQNTETQLAPVRGVQSTAHNTQSPLQNLEFLSRQTNPLTGHGNEHGTVQNTASSLQAEIIGFTAKGSLPVVNFLSAGGLFSQPYSLQFIANNLGQGSQIELQPHTTQLAQAAQSISSAAVQPLFASLTQLQWPALDELNQIMQQTGSQNLMQSVSQSLPSPAAPNKLPAAALLFISAMRGGDISGWMNDKTIETLRRLGKSDMLGRISRDMGSLSKSTSDPITQDWRGMPLPMAWENEISHVMLYYKKDDQADDENSENDRKKGTRFLFDLHLSKMGPVQLDGYHRKERLDLIVRTHERLSNEMQIAMRGLYVQALENVGTAGELSFQNKAEQWVHIQADKENTFYHA